MNIIALLFSIASVILSGYALYRTKSATTASTPDAGTRGAGGSGRR